MVPALTLEKKAGLCAPFQQERSENSTRDQAAILFSKCDALYASFPTSLAVIIGDSVSEVKEFFMSFTAL